MLTWLAHPQHVLGFTPIPVFRFQWWHQPAQFQKPSFIGGLLNARFQSPAPVRTECFNISYPYHNHHQSKLLASHLDTYNNFYSRFIHPFDPPSTLIQLQPEWPSPKHKPKPAACMHTHRHTHTVFRENARILVSVLLITLTPTTLAVNPCFLHAPSLLETLQMLFPLNRGTFSSLFPRRLLLNLQNSAQATTYSPNYRIFQAGVYQGLPRAQRCPPFIAPVRVAE